jgi:putative FmdB family regulatory protein
MPTYGYECKNCAHKFDVFQAITDEPVKSCTDCGEDVKRLIFGGTGVIFKGSGFYVTDKSKGSSGGKTKDSKTETAAESSKSDAGSSDACTKCPAATSCSKDSAKTA